MYKKWKHNTQSEIWYCLYLKLWSNVKEEKTFMNRSSAECHSHLDSIIMFQVESEIYTIKDCSNDKSNKSLQIWLQQHLKKWQCHYKHLWVHFEFCIFFSCKSSSRSDCVTPCVHAWVVPFYVLGCPTRFLRMC